MDSIAGLRTIKSIRATLDKLPKGLNDTYEKILAKIPKSDIEIAQRILLWLAFAVIPLTLWELHIAIAIDSSLDYFEEESRLGDAQGILDLCGSLVTVSDQGYVTLAHLSVKDYLLSSEIRLANEVSAFSMVEAEANHDLAISCLSYLSFRELAKGPSKSCDDYVERLTRNPLLKHASIGWPYYSRAAKTTKKLKTFMSTFFSPQMRGSFMSWVQILNAESAFDWDFYPRHATPLYYAASFGLDKIVDDCINAGHEINAPGSCFGGTALHGAVLRNHVPVMALLLKAGAEPSRADLNGVTPLHTAVIHGKMETVALLLEYGASKDSLDEVGDSPRDWATKAGRWDCVELLNDQRPISGVNDFQNASSQEGVGKHSGAYCPEFYRRRSGLGSSFVVKVEIGKSVL
jgi:hypothetical protein